MATAPKKKLDIMVPPGSDAEAKKKHLSFLRKNSGKTVYKRWADQQN